MTCCHAASSIFRVCFIPGPCCGNRHGTTVSSTTDIRARSQRSDGPLRRSTDKSVSLPLGGRGDWGVPYEVRRTCTRGVTLPTLEPLGECRERDSNPHALSSR